MHHSKILIFGSDVIGSVYGGLLAKSGQDVTMLARGKRYEFLKENGLQIQTGKHPVETYAINVIPEVQPQDTYDFVFVTIRAEQVDDALPVLAKVVSPSIVFMVNNAKGYDAWESVVGKGRIIPAFPGAGGKTENGIVYYNLTGKTVQPTTFGEINGKNPARIEILNQILKNAGFPTAISPDMDAWQKTHLALVCPLAYGIYYDGGNNYSLAKNKKAINQTCKALRESFNFIHRSKIGITPSKYHIMRFAPQFFFTRIIASMFNSEWAESVISNHALNAKSEMEYLTKDFVELAKSKGFELKELKKMM